MLKKSSKKYLFIALIFCCSHFVFAENYKYQRAEIFYMKWDILTRTRQTIEDVRLRYSVKTVIVDKGEVNKFLMWLQINEMQCAKVKMQEDARVVIDFYEDSNHRVTYYVSLFNLISEDGMTYRNIDLDFRNKFTFGGAW